MHKGVLVAVAVAGLGFGGAALADAAAHWAKTCSNCHEAADFSGKPPADIEAKIKAISAGTIKHKKKITVTDAEAKELATFLSTAK